MHITHIHTYTHTCVRTLLTVSGPGVEMSTTAHEFLAGGTCAKSRECVSAVLSIPSGVVRYAGMDTASLLRAPNLCWTEQAAAMRETPHRAHSNNNSHNNTMCVVNNNTNNSILLRQRLGIGRSGIAAGGLRAPGRGPFL